MITRILLLAKCQIHKCISLVEVLSNQYSLWAQVREYVVSDSFRIVEYALLRQGLESGTYRSLHHFAFEFLLTSCSGLMVHPNGGSKTYKQVCLHRVNNVKQHARMAARTCLPIATHICDIVAWHALDRTSMCPVYTLALARARMRKSVFVTATKFASTRRHSMLHLNPQGSDSGVSALAAEH
jgi:hypothetical protein